MTDTVIRVENLGKKYVIGHQKQERYLTLRDAIAQTTRSLGRNLLPTRHKEKQYTQEEFWALKDVSFEIKQGDRVGIIGRNGAGKSTLLKILSRITEPTTGRISIKGRVASLLEVGTGFHPELTGRENIYLNGAILGMGKTEISRKFDEIVAFAEVEKFLDTPVKRYSSGMYVRLAFAVAAHLEPEILVVDEVLAVGDTQFQKKCLGKMEEVGKEGRTVIFVSHNLSAVEKLCAHGIYLVNGCIKYIGVIETVVEKYLENAQIVSDLTSLKKRKDRQGSGTVRIVEFYALDRLGVKQNILRSGEDYIFIIEYENFIAMGEINDVVGSIAITDSREEIVFLVRSSFTNQNLNLFERSGKIECHIKDLNLAPGLYKSMLFLSHGEAEILDYITNATSILVEGGNFFGTGSIGLPSHCKVLTRAQWRLG